MFNIYVHTKIKMSSSNGLLVVIKTNVKYRYHVAAMLLYILQKNYLNKILIFFKDLLPSFQDPVLSGACVASTSHMFVLSHAVITNCRKVKCTSLVWPAVV
jgi:hypothetical protein